VQFTDEEPAVLGKRLSPSVGRGVSLESLTNDNARFHLVVDGFDPLPEAGRDERVALVVDGVVLRVRLPSQQQEQYATLVRDANVRLGATVYTEDSARVLAKAYKIEPMLRKHPGHRLAVKWATEKREYAPGAAVNATMTITNTGTEAIRFTHGGQQRGARDNQFRFVAQQGRAGKGLPDVGDPNNFGGISRSITLKPGESYSATVELTKWFKFEKRDTYRVTGIFEMPLIDPKSDDGFRPELWDELAVGEFVVRVVERRKE